MEKGKSVGSYFLFLIREGLLRVKRELFGWKGLAAAFIVFYLVVDLLGAMESYRAAMGQGIAMVWLVLLFPPRMGRLLYLLPFSVKERCRYLLMYLVTYLVFMIFVFEVVGAGACLISGYSYLEWSRIFVFSTVPLLMVYSGGMIYTVAIQKEPKESFSMVTPFYRNMWKEPDEVEGIREDCKKEKVLQKKKRSELTEEEWSLRKKELWFNAVQIIAVIFVVVQAYICPMFMGKNWVNSIVFWIGAVLAYGSAVIAVVVFWNRVWEQLNKKGSTGKEACGCNL